MPSPKINLPQQWVLPLSLSFLLVLLALVEIPMLQLGSGQVIYPLDDAYLRMATAKNLAAHGIWGLSPHEFTSATSSILYPILLAACFKVFGPQSIIPLLINLAAAVGCVITLLRWLHKQGLSAFHQLLITLVIVYLTPLHIMVADGMEHTLEIWLSLLFAFEFCDWMSWEKAPTGKYPALPWRVYLYGLLLAGIRYEGWFLVIVACIALLQRRKWMAVVQLGIVSLLPAGIFGLYSLSHDAYFIPNSLLVKAIPLPLDGKKIGNFFKEGVVHKLIYAYPTGGNMTANRLLIILPFMYLSYFSSLKAKRLYQYILYFLTAVTILHVVFADTTLFYRYEAYLVACGMVVPAVLLAQRGIPLFTLKKVTTRWVVVWTLIYLLYPFFSRSWTSFEDTGNSLLHEYQYNYQAARFLHTYYDDTAVVMDDLGMASFLSMGRKLDPMAGIAYTEITRAKVDDFMRNGYVSYLIAKEKPVIALIADYKYDPWLIQGWKKIATWYTTVRLPLQETELDFYAVDPSAATPLRANLRAFQATVLQGIRVEYY